MAIAGQLVVVKRDHRRLLDILLPVSQPHGAPSRWQSGRRRADSEHLSALPYLAAIAVLVLIWHNRQVLALRAPASLAGRSARRR